MTKRLLLALTMFALSTAGRAESLTVAALHPVLGDMARQVGGDRVSVTDVMKKGEHLHRFAPTPADLRAISKAKLVLLMGKNLESYRDKLADSLSKDQKLVEVGRKIPSITVSASSGLFLCCPAHSEGALDPHWWHSVENMRRAVKILASEFGDADPDGKAHYKANAKAADSRLKALQQWVKSQVASIPRSERKLATSHLAFSYFCKEYGFKAIGVQGLTQEQEPTVQYVSKTIELLKREKVKAVFPDKSANPKVLARISTEAGANIGGRLDSSANDTGSPVSYDAVMRHNVTTIVSGLK